jgi:hypothetical protein
MRIHIERGFLGEALAAALIFPHIALKGGDYLHTQEIILKKRLVLELLENLVLSFPELSYRIQIKPQYFVYEVMLDRVRVFPPLAYGLSNFLNEATVEKESELVLRGYMEALNQLEKEREELLKQKNVYQRHQDNYKFTIKELDGLTAKMEIVERELARFTDDVKEFENLSEFLLWLIR